MIGTTDKTVFTRLAEVLRKRIVTMIAAFGSFQKNKVNGKFGFSIMCQEFPIYLSLIVGYVYAMHLIVARHTYTVTFLAITRLPAISIRTNEKPVKAGRKTRMIQTAKRLRNHTGMVRGCVFFLLREEEERRAAVVLRRVFVEVLVAMSKGKERAE